MTNKLRSITRHIVYNGFRSENEYFRSNINRRGQKDSSLKVRHKAYASRYGHLRFFEQDWEKLNS